MLMPITRQFKLEKHKNKTEQNLFHLTGHCLDVFILLL